MLNFSIFLQATNLGIRLLLLACEVLKHNKNYSDAAMYYIKLTSEDSDVLSALMLEQAAASFLKAGNFNKAGLSRKFAFHMTLAGHRYSKAGQKLLSLRANVLASKVYDVKGLVLAEDHILYSVGKFSSQLKCYSAALKAYTQLVDARGRLAAPSKQSANQQMAYLREFLALYKLIETSRSGKKNSEENKTNDIMSLDALKSSLPSSDGVAIDGPLPELPDLPIPWLYPQECKLLLDGTDSTNSSANTDLISFASGVSFSNGVEELKEQWAGLERLVVERAQGMMIRRPIPQLLTQQTDNTRSPLLSTGESCSFLLPVMNPLLVNFTIFNVELLYKFIPENDSESSVVADKAVTQSCDVDFTVLAPGERRHLTFNLLTSQLGRILIDGVQYEVSLSSDKNDASSSVPGITGKQSLSVKGPRLNNNLKNRSSVTYALDKRLEICVVPPLPKVQVQFKGLPRDLHCGQMVEVDMTIENVGNHPITGLYIANADPKLSFVILQDNNLTASSEKNIEDSSRVTDVIHKTDSGDGAALQVGGKLHGKLWLRGQQVPGEQHLLLLFYCHSPHSNKPRYESANDILK